MSKTTRIILAGFAVRATSATAFSALIGGGTHA